MKNFLLRLNKKGGLDKSSPYDKEGRLDESKPCSKSSPYKLIKLL